MASRALADPSSRAVEGRYALALAAAVPVLFVHADFQPGFTIGAGATSVAVRLSDLAVLAVLAAAALDAGRRGLEPLRRGIPLWLPLGGLCAWVVAAAVYGDAVLPGFPVADNLVTAAKFVEYALLAPATALLVRDRDDLRPVLVVLVLWSAAATLVGLLQLAGLHVLDVSDPGRQRSFLGHHDFAALSGAAFLVGTASLLLEARRRRLALAAGGLGLVLAAPLAGLLGLGLALGGLLVLARTLEPFPWRRAAAAAALAAAVALGMLGMRAETIVDFLGFLATDEETTHIESYSHRTLLAYVGLRIFADHPVVGVGFQGSFEPAAFEPYLDDARARFPDAAPAAFPSAERPWGVQSLYVQALADLGLVGFALLLAVLAAAAGLAWRRRRTAAGALGLTWLLFVAGLWSSQGLVAGLPLGALTSVALGLAVAGARRRSDG